MIYESVTQLVGHTPLLSLGNLQKDRKLPGKLLAKLEFFNPGGSVKDRVSLRMLQEARKSGLLGDKAVIIEPTSGNTGIGLAAMAAAFGYGCIIVMPDSMSPERVQLMKAYGAQVVLTPGKEGMQGAVQEARRIAARTPGSFIPDQFANPANPLAHFETTGPELWEDTQGNIDIFVAGVGTGGTVTGVGRYLKEKNPKIQVIAAEPAGSPLLTQGKTGPHGLMGMGANFLPETLDKGILDRIVTVTEEEAYRAARALACTEGILAGISSGAALSAAMDVCRENPGKTVAVLLPDTGERYLSTPLFR